MKRITRVVGLTALCLTWAGVAEATSLCLQNGAGDAYVLSKVSQKAGKVSAVTGRAHLSGGGNEPVAGTAVVNSDGSILVLGLTEYLAVAQSGVAGATNGTRFHQIAWRLTQSSLLDCHWETSGGTFGASGCDSISLIDCKTIPAE